MLPAFAVDLFIAPREDEPALGSTSRTVHGANPSPRTFMRKTPARSSSMSASTPCQRSQQVTSEKKLQGRAPLTPSLAPLTSPAVQIGRLLAPALRQREPKKTERRTTFLAAQGEHVSRFRGRNHDLTEPVRDEIGPAKGTDEAIHVVTFAQPMPPLPPESTRARIAEYRLSPRDERPRRWTPTSSSASTDARDDGTRVLFDHVGWKDAEEMVRIVTFGWVQMFLRLEGYAESGKPQPFFDF